LLLKGFQYHVGEDLVGDLDYGERGAPPDDDDEGGAPPDDDELPPDDGDESMGWPSLRTSMNASALLGRTPPLPAPPPPPPPPLAADISLDAIFNELGRIDFTQIQTPQQALSLIAQSVTAMLAAQQLSIQQQIALIVNIAHIMNIASELSVQDQMDFVAQFLTTAQTQTGARRRVSFPPVPTQQDFDSVRELFNIQMLKCLRALHPDIAPHKLCLANHPLIQSDYLALLRHPLPCMRR